MCEQNPDDWESNIPLAVWGWRVTPQKSLGGRSPYRVVLGLEPRTPFGFSSTPVGRKPVGVREYVRDLAETYQNTIQYVRDFKADQQDQRIDVGARKGKPGQYEIGDFVLVLRPQFIQGFHRPGPVSKKLLHRVYDEVYQVYHKLNPATYILRRAGTGEEPVGLENPVNLTRVIPAVTWHVKGPVGAQQKAIDICQEDETTYKRAHVIAYGYAGVIKVQYEGEDAEEWIDLTQEQYRWVV